MTFTVHYRLLEDDSERIIAGDEFKPQHLGDEHWQPCTLFIGHRLRDLRRTHVLVRRRIAADPTPKEDPKE